MQTESYEDEALGDMPTLPKDSPDYDEPVEEAEMLCCCF